MIRNGAEREGSRDGEALRAPGEGFVIRPLQTARDLQAAVALQEEIWGSAFAEAVPPSVMLAAQEVGGLAAGAFSIDDELAGFLFGITGIRDGRPTHWSDSLAVGRAYQGGGLGERLKRYQRHVLLEMGIDRVLWTFEPLESKNAHLNLSRLGAVVREYRRDFYGVTASPLHQGIGTDRLVALWEIAGERVQERLCGRGRPPAPQDAAVAPLVNPTRRTARGLESLPPDLDLAAPRLRLAVPADIQSLKRRDPELAADWRGRTRLAFETYLGRGYQAVELVREDERSCYLLEKLEPDASRAGPA